jgi:hypothetical protein
MLRISTGPGETIPCPLSTVDKKNAMCGFVGGFKGGILIYRIELLSKDGGRVQIGVRSKFGATTSGTYSLSAVDDIAEKQYWFEPGETLQTDVAGMGPMAVTGEWMDHMPSPVAGNRDVDPGPGELRMNSTLLLKGKQLVGDMDGGSASVDEPGQGVMIYIPDQGRFVVALSQFEGAVQANVKLNRLSFEIDNQHYVFVTGTPITRSARVWVRLEPNYKPSAEYGDQGFVGSVSLSSLDKQ